MNIISLSNSVALVQAQKNVTQRHGAWSNILIDDEHGNILNAAGTVHYDDYKDLTTDVVKAREFMNVGIQDLIAAGLSQPSSITKTIVQYQTSNTKHTKKCFTKQICIGSNNYCTPS